MELKHLFLGAFFMLSFLLPNIHLITLTFIQSFTLSNVQTFKLSNFQMFIHSFKHSKV